MQRKTGPADLKSETRGKQTRGERLTAAMSSRANWAVSSSQGEERRGGWGQGDGVLHVVSKGGETEGGENVHRYTRERERERERERQTLYKACTNLTHLVL